MFRMKHETLKREFVQRQTNDRRKAANAALRRHFDIVDRRVIPTFEDRRKSDRRASDNDAVADWVAKFDQLR